MRNIVTRLIVSILLFILALTISISAPALIQQKGVAQQISDSPPLFTEVEKSTSRGLFSSIKDPTIVRQRFVKVNSDLLVNTRGGTVKINLFDDVSYNVIFERVNSAGQTRGAEESVTRFGRIEGIPDSEVYLVNRGDAVSGNLRLPDGKLYEIRFLCSGVHAIREMNQRAFPQEAHPLKVKLKGSSPRGITQVTSKGTPATVDVMVVYTPDAVKAAGSLTAINNLIDLAELETNQGYANSGVSGQIHIVYRQQADYSESGDAEIDLERLSNPSDGYLDNIQTLRKQYSADAVSLWVSAFEPCGIGYIMESPAHEFRDRAFSVIKLECATGYYSFAHELGHNFGCTHDKNHATGSGIYPYSYGYQNPSYLFRTIMAYNCDRSCTRINYWSNPQKKYQNQPLGITGETDNHQSLNNTMSVAADWF